MGDYERRPTFNRQPQHEGKLHTYDEWRKRGMQVQSGQKHIYRDNITDEPLFNFQQVKPHEKREPYPSPRVRKIVTKLPSGGWIEEDVQFAPPTPKREQWSKQLESEGTADFDRLLPAPKTDSSDELAAEVLERYRVSTRAAKDPEVDWLTKVDEAMGGMSDE